MGKANPERRRRILLACTRIFGNNIAIITLVTLFSTGSALIEHLNKEGLKETLTIHQLGLATELRKSFISTNCIESVMAHLGQYTDKVDCWRDGDYIQLWVAARTSPEDSMRL